MVKRIFVFTSVIALLFLLTACNGMAGTSSTASSTPISNMAIGSFRMYALPQADSGLMRPAIDHKGRIWFGEMNHNYLASFDPRTRTFQQMIPPHGAYGVMGVAIATDDTVWFSEQNADYIGHYFPTTKRYRVYNLPTIKVPDPSNKSTMLSLPSGPNDLALDAHGNVWFTELNANALGMLDVQSGTIKQYPLPLKQSGQALDPYGVTVDAQGNVWFTETETGSIGRLNPNTGHISLFTMPGPVTPFMEIASDPHGIIWATSFNDNLLVRLNPQTGVFNSYKAPSTGKGTNGLYGIVVASTSEVWVTVPAENAIARFDSITHRFMYYHIPTAGSFPFGLVMGPNNTLWFTEARSDALGMLKI